MRLWQSARISFRALRVNLLRTALAVLGIVIGVAAVIAMVAVGSGAEARVAEQIKSLGSNLIIVRPGSSITSGARLGAGTQLRIVEDDAEAIEHEIDSVEAAAAYRDKTVQVVYGALNWATRVNGVTANYLDVRDWPLAAGRAIEVEDVRSAAKVALLGQTIVQNVFPYSDPVGEIVRLANVPFARHENQNISRHRIIERQIHGVRRCIDVTEFARFLAQAAGPADTPLPQRPAATPGLVSEHRVARAGRRPTRRLGRSLAPSQSRTPRFRGTAGFRCALARPLDQAQPQRIGLSTRAVARSGVTRLTAAARSQSRFVAISDNRVPPPPDGTARRSGSPSRAGPGGLAGEEAVRRLSSPPAAGAHSLTPV